MPGKAMPREHGHEASAVQKQIRKRQKRSTSGKAYRTLLQRPLAPLERLPPEILLQIFDLACDMNLAKASWHLMKKLDGHPIYQMMMAFSSDAALIGLKKKSSLADPCSVALAGLPTMSPQNRVRLQTEVFAKKWLEPRLVRRAQSCFVNELIRERWAALCLRKSYGTFKVRPSQRALWRETRAEEAQFRIEEASAYFEILEGVVRFVPEIGQDVVEEYSFPACNRRPGNNDDLAPFPDHWFAGPWTDTEKTLIMQFAKNRYREHLSDYSSNPEDFASWMLHLAILEQRVDLLLKYLLHSPGNAGNRYVLSASAINRSHFTKFLASPGVTSWEDVHMAVVLSLASEFEPSGPSLLSLKQRLRDWLRDRLPPWD